MTREAGAAATPIQGESNHIKAAKEAAAAASVMRTTIDVLDFYTAITDPESATAPDNYLFRLTLNVPSA
jgi:hypothetical protein